MPYSSGLQSGKVAQHRATSAAIAADNATLTDANIPPAAALDCSGYETVFVSCDITAGTNPTLTIEPLYRDEDAADGNRWRRLMVGSPDGVTLGAAAAQSTGALAPQANMVEIRVAGWKKVFFRVSAVANSAGTTAWSILVMPGKRRPSVRDEY
jgi:hypothetical protein